MQFLQLKLATKIALLSFCLVLLSVLSVAVAIVERTSQAAETEIGMRAMAIARTVAQLKDVQENLDQINGAKIIQPVAEKIRLATGVEYIVIFNQNRVRFSHPLQDRIGTLFTDGDEERALNKEEYLSYTQGVSGPAIRAFVPVMTDEGTRQVGVVTVGILTPTITETLKTLHLQLYSSLLLGLVLGIGGSVYLARNIKRNMFSLEPQEIARMLEERVAIFQALGEGVIAIDREGHITILNNEACRITGSTESKIGEPVGNIVAIPGLSEVMISGEALLNRELVIENTLVLANILPVKVKEKLVGAVITFRDKTEVNELAEELTGVKTFIEALRVQNHESLNKMHPIAGLIQLKKYHDAVDYIFAVTEEQ
ncbi:MAG TPA: Spo0B domain-containing protein, partial [Verrucomicrobiae bacterium]|nr:Spo0B domain-containing protein [Verrucomicrobiae bacterium]